MNFISCLVKTSVFLSSRPNIRENGKTNNSRGLCLIWVRCCPRVPAGPCMPNGSITQHSPYLTRKPGTQPQDTIFNLVSDEFPFFLLSSCAILIHSAIKAMDYALSSLLLATLSKYRILDNLGELFRSSPSEIWRRGISVLCICRYMGDWCFFSTIH